MTVGRLAATIDHTNLHPDSTKADIQRLCQEARKYRFASVCISPTWIPLAVELLADSPVRVCTVIGFPSGATLSNEKAFETAEAIAAGADEVDMVINIGRLKDGDDEYVQSEIAAVVRAARAAADARPLRPDLPKLIVKVIIETALLSDEQKRRSCLLAKKAGADFVKTSTGFSKGGATVADVRLMRKTVGPLMGVKAAGGIHSAQTALDLLAAGADRLGASAGVQIIEDARQMGMAEKLSGEAE